MRDIILHHHIFKNSGSSLIASLRSNFGENMIQIDKADTNSKLCIGDLEELCKKEKKIQCISSNHLFGQYFKSSKLKFYNIILFRDPIKRYLSTYSYYKTISNAGYNKTLEFEIQIYASKYSFREFMLYLFDSNYDYVSNPQCKLLLLSNSEKYIDLKKVKILEDDFEIIKKKLINFEVIGTTETYLDTINFANAYFKNIFNKLTLSFEHRNISSYPIFYDGTMDSIRSHLGSLLWDKIQQENYFDFKLCRFAEATLKERNKDLL